jgi:hypothetical protein
MVSTSMRPAAQDAPPPQPAEPRPRSRPAGPPPPPPRLRRCAVLDEIPALAADVPPAARATARRAATAALVRLEPGPQPLDEWYGRRSLRGPGLLLMRGLIAREVRVACRTATELLGPGDVIRPWEVDVGDPVAAEVAWQVLIASDVALLDAFFADRVRPWPQINSELVGRSVRRAHALAIQHAIASHPRLDLRVALLLWHLAGRWGRVLPDGEVCLDLPLTHRLIGELVGAERPSVSHAVGRLSRAGLVTRCRDGWHLRGRPEELGTVAPVSARTTDPGVG